MSKKILVVDDECETVRAVRLSLEQIGFQVITADNGRQAVELATSETPDLVLMDVTMPEMTGFQALQKLKSDQNTAHIPVVLLTADHSDGSRCIAREAGSDLYLTKPFNPTELVNRVMAVLAA